MSVVLRVLSFDPQEDMITLVYYFRTASEVWRRSYVCNALGTSEVSYLFDALSAGANFLFEVALRFPLLCISFRARDPGDLDNTKSTGVTSVDVYGRQLYA